MRKRGGLTKTQSSNYDSYGESARAARLRTSRRVDMAKAIEQILETIVGDVTMSVMAVDGVDCLVTVQKLGSKAADVPDSASGKMKNVAITKDWLKTGLVWKGYDIVLGHCSTHLRPVKKDKK